MVECWCIGFYLSVALGFFTLCYHTFLVKREREVVFQLFIYVWSPDSWRNEQQTGRGKKSFLRSARFKYFLRILKVELQRFAKCAPCSVKICISLLTNWNWFNSIYPNNNKKLMMNLGKNHLQWCQSIAAFGAFRSWLSIRSIFFKREWGPVLWACIRRYCTWKHAFSAGWCHLPFLPHTRVFLVVSLLALLTRIDRYDPAIKHLWAFFCVFSKSQIYAHKPPTCLWSVRGILWLPFDNNLNNSVRKGATGNELLIRTCVLQTYGRDLFIRWKMV